MKKVNLFLVQTLLVLSLTLVIGCSKDDDKGDEIPSGGLKIGQPYQGGKIFYVDDTGKHGLMAAPNDEMGLYTWSEALAVCQNKSLSGYNDWYLPSRSELHELYLNREAVGGFANERYWSSSEYYYDYAWYQYFNSGNQNYYYKYDSYRVRAVRAF